MAVFRFMPHLPGKGQGIKTTGNPTPLPFLRWWPDVTRETLRADIGAGLTGSMVILPQGVAFALVAGLPPEFGLYAAMAPAIIAALFGSSRLLVSGPTTAASLLVFSSLTVYAEPGSSEYIDLALTLTFMVGAMQLVLGLTRAGGLVRFISYSVVVGLTAGAAILIVSTQLGNFFGVDVPRGVHVHNTVIHFLGQIPNVNPYATSVAVVTVLAGIAARKWLPRSVYLMVALLAGTVAAALLNAGLGSGTTAIGHLGGVPRSLPPITVPHLTLDNMRLLGPAALAVTLFALTEAIAIGRALGLRTDQRVDGNQEFIGQGLSNLVGSFLSAYVSTGSFNRSAINLEAGARTPLAAVLAGFFLLGIVLIAGPLAAYLPDAATAGVLALVSWSLIDFRALRRIFSSDRRETVVVVVTFLATMFLELEFAVFAGVILSLALYLEKVSRPFISRRAPDPESARRKFSGDEGLPECPQFAFLRVDGSLFFGSVDYVQEVLDEARADHPEQKYLAIMSQGINSVDIAGADMLAREATDRRKRGGDLFLVRAKQGMLDSLRRFGCHGVIGEANIFEGKSAAIQAVFARLNRNVCASCTARIFLECASLPPPGTDRG